MRKSWSLPIGPQLVAAHTTSLLLCVLLLGALNSKFLRALSRGESDL